MTRGLVDLLSAPWSYAVILGTAGLEALVPSETLAIAFGVTAVVWRLR